MNPYRHNMGAFIKPLYASHKAAIVAGSGTDNTTVTGSVIDKDGYDSGLLNVCYAMTLTTGKGATLTETIADSADNSTWNSATTLVSAVEIEAATTGGAVKDCYTKEIDLTPYERYIKFTTLLDLEATQTDTGDYQASLILGGAVVLPAV
jgi:hypothetical protein